MNSHGLAKKVRSWSRRSETDRQQLDDLLTNDEEMSNKTALATRHQENSWPRKAIINEARKGRHLALWKASNKALQRRPRSRFLIVPGLPFAAPLNAGVRQLTAAIQSGRLNKPEAYN